MRNKEDLKSFKGKKIIRFNELQSSNEKHLKLSKIIVFFVGIITTLVAVIGITFLYTVFNDNKNNVFWQVFNSVFMACLPIGMTSIIYAFFDRLSYAREQIAKVLFEEEGFLNLSEKKQIYIKDTIEQNLCYKDRKDPNNIYTVVQNELRNIIDDIYIEEAVIQVDCSFKNQRIYKQIKETYTYQVPNLANKKSYNKPISDLLPQPAFYNPMCTNCQKSNCNECEECPIKVLSLSIDNVPQENVSIGHKTLLDDPKYLNKFIIGETLENIIFSASQERSNKVKNKVVIDFLSQRITNLDDTLFVHKSKFATRNFTLHVDYNPNEMSITPAGFCFMDKDMIGKRMKIEHFPRSLKIRFQNWILPGNGVMFNIVMKKTKR